MSLPFKSVSVDHGAYIYYTCTYIWFKLIPILTIGKDQNEMQVNCYLFLWVNLSIFENAVIFCFQRSKVVTGGVEPTDEECDWPSDEEKEDEKVAQLSVKISLPLLYN